MNVAEMVQYRRRVMAEQRVRHAASARSRRRRWVPLPGDALKWLAGLVGIRETPGCGCGSMRKQMNGWGWRTCWRYRRLIVRHLVGEARQRLARRLSAWRAGWRKISA